VTQQQNALLEIGNAMRWNNLVQYYGLQRPFNLNVAVPLLLSLLGLLILIIVGLSLLSTGRLSIGTERWYFFSYMTVLLVIAAAMSRAPAVSLAIFLWCATESSLAFASAALEARGIGLSLLPKNWFTEPTHSGFEYHPVLGLAPKRNWHGSVRFDERNRSAQESFWPVNRNYYEEAVYSHNSLGLRGRELSRKDLEKQMIFAVGGSSTYDWNVTQGSTWVERLESSLHNRFTVVNFGAPIHGTAQHLIYTAFYQDQLGKRPVCAIYYAGWNDLLNVHVEDLDPAYANFMSLYMVVRKSQFWAAKYSPFARLVYIAAQSRFDSVPGRQKVAARKGSRESEEQLEKIFVENIRTIAAINRSRGVKTILVAQMANSELVRLRPRLTFFSPFAKHEDILRLNERFNALLKSTSASSGAGYIDAGAENFVNADFADMVHFSAAGSAKFSRLISDGVESYCQ
jgi:hypothetical protein